MKVSALRVEVNGELVAVAGAEGLSLLTGSVGYGPGSSDATHPTQIVFNVMGLAVTGPQPRQLSWGDEVRLKLGDRVTFELVEVDHPNPPTKILRSPSSEELAAVAAASKKRRSPREPKV
jgi:hypothetical protein